MGGIGEKAPGAGVQGAGLWVWKPRKLIGEDYYVRNRGYSAIGWLIRYLGGLEQEELDYRPAVVEQERMLCDLLGVEKVDLMALEMFCSESPWDRRVAFFCTWCELHGIEVRDRVHRGGRPRKGVRDPGPGVRGEEEGIWR